MAANRWTLGNKTEYIQFGTKAQLSKMSSHEKNIGDDTIKASDYVRDLGVMLDNLFRMANQVRHMLK